MINIIFSKNQPRLLVILLLLTFFGLLNTGITDGIIRADDPVTWNPLVPYIGDEVTITYDPAATAATLSAAASQIYLIWGMYLPGNELLAGKTYGSVPPSIEMWPENTSLVPPYRFVKTSMVKNEASGIWSTSFELNDKPDYLMFFFEDEILPTPNNDKNGGNYWFIDTQLQNHRIRVLSPTFAQPLITTGTTEIEVDILAPETATNWDLVLKGIGTSFQPSLSTSYNANEGIWTLTFLAPTTMGLYDMMVTAQSGSSIYSDWEPNSIKIIDQVKSSYKFMVFGDPQFHRDGSAGAAYRGQESGIGNFTDLLQEVNIIHPEFILVLGDLTEWTDEIALENFRKWCNIYLEDVPVVSILGNHCDYEGTASTGLWEWGTGAGMWEHVIGPSEGIFYYGNHAFVRGNSHSREFNVELDEYNFVMDSLDEIDSADMKFLLLHHPLSQYGGYSGDETIRSETELNTIINKLGSIEADAYLHGHLHVDKYDVLNGVVHLSTTESAGDNPGYRVISIVDNEIVDFSYDEPDLATYSASSNPPDKVNKIFSAANDGSLNSLSVNISNSLNHSLNNGFVLFKMIPGVYSSNGGNIYYQNTLDDITYVAVNFDLSATSSKEVSVLKIGEIPTTTITSEETTTEISTSTTTQNTPGLLLLEFLIILPILVLKKRRFNS